LKYVLYGGTFESDDHEKTWLLRVAINLCKDLLKNFFRRRVKSLEDVSIEPFYIQDEDKGILDAVLKLPEKYKDIIYLFYYEGYTAIEIAKILHKNENTIYTWLSRAKSKLKEMLGGEQFD
jgi:RNA polymerase sigma-70 factor (ECF subfamily)